MKIVSKRDLVGSPYRSEREKLIKIERWSVKKFFILLDTLEDFFKSDKCCRLADNYLIGMVFTYFLRASLESDEYTKQNFFAALYLAYIMEEDEAEFMLMEIECWLESSVADLKQLQYAFFRRLEYRAAVSRSCCDIIMKFVKPAHKIWQRHRHIYHSGVLNNRYIHRKEEVCLVCNGDSEEVDC